MSGLHFGYERDVAEALRVLLGAHLLRGGVTVAQFRPYSERLGEYAVETEMIGRRAIVIEGHEEMLAPVIESLSRIGWYLE